MLAPPGWPQEREDRPPRPQRAARRSAQSPPDRVDRPKTERPPDGREGRGTRPLAAELPIRPGPEDAGPLRPGEEEELFVFAQRALPADMVNAMRRLRSRDPDGFRRVMEMRAPRLRFLRRLFEINPQLARDIVDHAANMNAIRRAREFLRARPDDPGRRRRAVNVIRERCAASVRLEARILAERARMLETSRDGDAERALQRLLAPEADLAAEPPEIREAVQALRDAVSAADQRTARARLKELLATRIDQEIQELRRREQRLRAGAAAEVDRRVARALSSLVPSARPAPDDVLRDDADGDEDPPPNPPHSPPP